MQEIKVTDTYKCPLCGEKLIEVRLGVTNATRTGQLFKIFSKKKSIVVRKGRMCTNCFSVFPFLADEDIEKYLEYEFDNFIIDEAQNIKNAFSQTTEAVKKIKAKEK